LKTPEYTNYANKLRVGVISRGIAIKTGEFGFWAEGLH